jgi:hypothetical protein
VDDDYPLHRCDFLAVFLHDCVQSCDFVNLLVAQDGIESLHIKVMESDLVAAAFQGFPGLLSYGMVEAS